MMVRFMSFIIMESDIHDYDIAYADETPLQVLKEKDRLATQKSYMWLFIGGPPDKRAFVYQYHPTRSHQVPLLPYNIDPQLLNDMRSLPDLIMPLKSGVN